MLYRGSADTQGGGMCPPGLALGSYYVMKWYDNHSSGASEATYFFLEIDAPLLDKVIIILQIYVELFQPLFKHSVIKVIVASKAI